MIAVALVLLVYTSGALLEPKNQLDVSKPPPLDNSLQSSPTKPFITRVSAEEFVTRARWKCIELFGGSSSLLRADEASGTLYCTENGKQTKVKMRAPKRPTQTCALNDPSCKAPAQVNGTGLTEKAEGGLRKCPKSQNVQWHNCFGTYKYPSGDQYVGEFKKGKRHGRGTYTFKNGRIDIGEFKDDSLNGHGSITFSSGDRYVGYLRDDVFNGQGAYTFKDGRIDVGEFKDGKLNGDGSITYANGDRYVGGLRDDKFNGLGTFTFSNDGEYVGEFRDGLRDGNFSVTYRNGDKFVGVYSSDLRNGQGTYIWNDGSRLVGQFKQWIDGVVKIDGTHFLVNGDVLVGAKYTTRGQWSYEGDHIMLEPDILTYSGGSIQQKTSD
jgi:hypothetical protein